MKVSLKTDELNLLCDSKTKKIIYVLWKDNFVEKQDQAFETMVRPLSKELQNIAIEELFEVPERIEEDVKHIQEWIKQQPHLNAPTDNQWILGFLRGCKFSLQRTKEKYEMFYTIKNVMPELMKARDIHSMEIQSMLKAGAVLPLPYTDNHKGPRVILIRFQDNLDTQIMTMKNFTAVFYIILNILMVEDDNLIISGVLFWFDLSHFPLSFIFKLTPTYLRNSFELLQNAYPFRVKGIHASGSFALVERILTLIKGYLGPKLKDRIFLYSEDTFENIYKVIPKSCVPIEYGGENSSLQEITDYWTNKAESYYTWFTESGQYGVNEAKRPRKPASSDDVQSVGSFRKLNID